MTSECKEILERSKHMLETTMLWTPAQTARMMNISRSQLYILLKRGDLKSVHIGRSRRIATDQINQFIDNLKDTEAVKEN